MIHSTEHGRGYEAIVGHLHSAGSAILSQTDVALAQFRGDALNGLLGPSPLLL
jgi:hypothetical protein